MTARDQVLARVRTAIRADAGRREVPWPLVPEVGHGVTGEALLTLFVERVEDYRATVRVVTAEELSGAVRQALGERDPLRVLLPDDLDLELPADVTVTLDRGQLDVRELDRMHAVVTRSAVGIAETGTIVLDAGAGQGRRALTLVPDHHVVIVRETDIVETVPAGLARLEPDRPITLISGPSATSDIELNRVEGVHGPRQLDVLVVRAPG